MNRVTALIVVAVLAMSALAAEERTEVKDPNCIIKTNKGDIVVRLFASEAPKTVANFIGLADGSKVFTDPETKLKVKRPFYSGLIFHRVIKDFMIQGGCPLGTGTGDAGYKFEDEINADALGLDKIKAVDAQDQPHKWLFIRSVDDLNRVIRFPLYRAMGIKTNDELRERLDEVNQRIKALTLKDVYTNLGYKYNDKLKSHALKRGVLAMANSGPNTNGSQFFINLKDTPWLTGKHTVFGEVVKGMDVVDKIGDVAVGAGSRPKDPVTIISIQPAEPEK